MRFGAKAMIWAACAGPAIAAMVVTTAGTANAATVSPVGHTTSSNGPWSGRHACETWVLEQWNLNGKNTVDATWNGGNYTYAVTFVQKGSCLSGTLTDTGLPSGQQRGPITGTVVGNHVRFSFTYPTNVQGTRTFTGTISKWGTVSGTWQQTGIQTPNNGTWSLASKARPACPPWFRLFLRGCRVG
jgi:hypothetical protein